MTQTDFEGETTMNAPAKIKSPLQEIQQQLERQTISLKAALPPHIRVDHFQRIVMTAINNSPNLATLDRRTLWIACTQAAQDGLLPDGREGAIVPFKGKAKWMPMYAGLLKKARNSGEIASIVARVVYEGDTYRYWIDEQGEHLIYEPADNPNLSVVRKVFAMARTKDGELLVEPMSKAEVEKIRSMAPNGNDRDSPWATWWDEMAKKTAIRRLSKRLPASPDLLQAIQRDDEMYDLKTVRGREIPDDDDEPRRPVRSLDDFGKAGNGRRRKAEAEPPKRRGRKPKEEPTDEKPAWLEDYREKIGNAATQEDVTEAWDGIADEFEEAPDEVKAEASELYNAAMDRLEPAGAPE